MAFSGGYVVENMAIPSGKEPFNGELCRSRSTQTSNAVGGSKRWTAAVPVSFFQRSEDRSRSFEKTSQRHKDSGRGHGIMVMRKADLVSHLSCLSTNHQIEFTEWTPDGHLRHSKFVGLRDDREAREVVREIEG